jgi:mRNA-degrading endonuclease RelE of RelBE toxin-antitoxin system
VTYRLNVTRTARRDINERLPLSVAAAVIEFVSGALVENPHRVGKPLDQPYEGVWSARKGSYRVLYEIDETNKVVVILHVAHRRDVYRPR